MHSARQQLHANEIRNHEKNLLEQLSQIVAEEKRRAEQILEGLDLSHSVRTYETPATSRTKPVTRFTCCGMRANTNIFSWSRLGSTKKYTVKDYNRAVRTLHALKKELDAFFTEDIPF